MLPDIAPKINYCPFCAANLAEGRLALPCETCNTWGCGYCIRLFISGKDERVREARCTSCSGSWPEEHKPVTVARSKFAQDSIKGMSEENRRLFREKFLEAMTRSLTELDDPAVLLHTGGADEYELGVSLSEHEFMIFGGYPYDSQFQQICITKQVVGDFLEFLDNNREKLNKLHI